MWLPQFRQEQSWKWLMSCCPVSLQHDDYTHQRGMRVSLFIKIAVCHRISAANCVQEINHCLIHCNDHIAMEWNIPGEFAELCKPQLSLLKSRYDMENSRTPKSPSVFGSAESVCVSLTWSLRVHCSVHMSVMRLRACLGHLVQEHVAKGQAAVSDVVPLQGGTDKETLVEISLSTTPMLARLFDFQYKVRFTLQCTFSMGSVKLSMNQACRFCATNRITVLFGSATGTGNISFTFSISCKLQYGSTGHLLQPSVNKALNWQRITQLTGWGQSDGCINRFWVVFRGRSIWNGL